MFKCRIDLKVADENNLNLSDFFHLQDKFQIINYHTRGKIYHNCWGNLLNLGNDDISNLPNILKDEDMIKEAISK